LNSPLCCSLSYSLPQFLVQTQQVSFLHLLTYVYIIWTTLSSLLPPPTFGQNLFLSFCMGAFYFHACSPSFILSDLSKNNVGCVFSLLGTLCRFPIIPRIKLEFLA
jgi:hypothetical protein